MKSVTPFVPKRGRPSSEQKKAIERAILDAARRLFFRSGFDALTMDRVAARAGVSKGTLYSRYPSKEELFIAVCDLCFREWSEADVESWSKLPSDPAKRLKMHARLTALAFARPDVQALQQLSIQMGLRFPQVTEQIHKRGYLLAVNSVAADMEQSERANGRKPRDMRNVSELVIGAIVGWQLNRSWREDIPIKEILKYADRVADIIVKGREGW